MFERHREVRERRKTGEASDYGFTLIELLIVIVVLGILAAIVIFSLTGVSTQSRQAACSADGKSVEIAADAYQAANAGSYPSNITLLTPAYLHSLPVTTNGYSFSLGSNTVDVLVPATSTVAPVAYDTTGGCSAVS
jgi:general secretion pathway protein G